MQLTLLDPNVSITMNIFLSIANVINLIYNLPQVIKTYKTKSTKDFSSWFIFLRILGNIIWIIYAIDIDSLQMLINTSVTVLASVFIGYYKALELYTERKETLNYDELSLN
jgi:MtN3 and saliva related transmembrane protein